MKILVTGGVGSVGKALIDRLNRHGHSVTVIGRRSGLTVEGAEYRSCDVTNYDDLLENAGGQDGIIHLAAIPNPLNDNDQEIFRVNCSGTFNVYQAAARLAIKNIVSASSINALGFFFGVRQFPLDYFPIDENHYCMTSDPYSYSKEIVESIGDYFWRRYQLSSVNIRLPWVYDADNEYLRNMGRWRRMEPELINRMLKLPAEEAVVNARTALDLMEAFERENKRDGQASWHERRRKIVDAMNDMEKAFFFLAWGRANFWAALDCRDSARIIEKALISNCPGHHKFFVCDKYNISGIETEWLLRAYFPDVKKRLYPIEDRKSLLCLKTATEKFDFDPRYRFPYPVKPY